jgi:3-phosphoshikimate 1-carboxyvinyltransferase
MGRISAPLRELGASVDGPEDGTLAPLTIRGVIRDGGTHRSKIASAQVKSAILLAAVRAGVGVTVTAPLPSRDHTERMLRFMGMDVQSDTTKGEKVVLVAGTPEARTLQVPADPSSAAFWWVAAAIGGTTVTTPDVACNPGRIGSLRVLEALGAQVVIGSETVIGEEPVGTVTVSGGDLRGSATLSGVEVVDAIDELPVLAIASALSDGGLEVTDAKELRVKESDRIAALERLFDALGMEIDARPDGFTVPGGQEPTAGTFDADLDHRLAMSAAVAATVAAGPVTIHGFAGTATSYPTFADDLERLGGQVDQDVT